MFRLYEYTHTQTHIYGELINIINLEGLCLSNEYKLKKLKERKKDIGKQLGSFRDQYSFSKEKKHLR